MLTLQVLRCYGTEWIVEIKDITGFIHEQYEHIKSNRLDQLTVAKERVYPVTDSDTVAQIGVDPVEQDWIYLCNFHHGEES